MREKSDAAQQQAVYAVYPPGVYVYLVVPYE